jgi:deoxycytidine triphosphate deaminase
MVLSDRTMKEEIAKGRIVIEPLNSIYIQPSFLRLTSPAERLYGSASLGSKYQGQNGPTATRYYEDFIKEK